MNLALRITGSFHGATGYDQLVRSATKALLSRGLDLEFHDMPDWSPWRLPARDSAAPNGCSGKLASVDAHLHFCMPHQVVLDPTCVNVNCTMFEADRIPTLWAIQSTGCDMIAVPSRSSRDAWIRSGVPQQKVIVVPLGVDQQLFSPIVKPLALGAADRDVRSYGRRFLNVSDASERKNIAGLLVAWLAGTQSNDDAVLLIKTPLRSHSGLARLLEYLRFAEGVARQSVSEAAPIFWINGVLASKEMPRLYACATHYISLSHGEGFDLAMLEAAATDLELIAPRHSAYLDYLDDGCAHLVPSRPIPASRHDDFATAQLFHDAYWWEPNPWYAAELIRKTIDGGCGLKQSSREAISQLTWPETARRIVDLLSDLLCR